MKEMKELEIFEFCKNNLVYNMQDNETLVEWRSRVFARYSELEQEYLGKTLSVTFFEDGEEYKYIAKCTAVSLHKDVHEEKRSFYLNTLATGISENACASRKMNLMISYNDIIQMRYESIKVEKMSDKDLEQCLQSYYENRKLKLKKEIEFLSERFMNKQ